jgi:hypothetical protein
LARTATRQNNKQQQLLLVAWLPSSKIAHQRDMKHEKERTSRCSDNDRHHGWSTMGQGMMRRGSSTPTPSSATTDNTAILDSGCTSNVLSAAAPCRDKQAARVTLNVNMPNGATNQSSHTCNLLPTYVPPQAQQAHILPGLVHNSLISVGQLCDNDCSFTFTQDQVTVSKNGKHVMYGARDPKSRLWAVNLKHKFETENVQCNHAHDNSNQKDLINYLHAACFSPVKLTWITAIKNGNF